MPSRPCRAKEKVIMKMASTYVGRKVGRKEGDGKERQMMK